MTNKILIAVDESPNSTKAVNYVAETMEKTGSVTLFSVLPDAAATCEVDMDNPGLKSLYKNSLQTFCAIEAAKKNTVKESMEKAKECLVQAGFSSTKVKIKVQKKKIGIARDVINEAQQGKYSTIVIGRRGLSGIKQFVLGSVSNKIVQLAKKVSVIIVD